MQSDELERLLQAGLKNYGDAEPLSGLEERVLRRMQERRAGRGWVWFRWATVTVCACLLLAVVFGNRADWPVRDRLTHGVQSTAADAARGRTPRADVNQTAPEKSRRIEPGGPELHAIHERSGKSLAVKQIEPRPERLPKLEMFPTPQPLSAEESALVEFVNQHPKEVQQLVDAERRSSEPIQIAAIHIEPLTMDGPRQEGEKNAKEQ
jgi:hypothetical protein